MPVVRGTWRERRFSGHTICGTADGAGSSSTPYGSEQNGIEVAVQIDINTLPTARCMGASIVRRGSGTRA